ncbi:TIGR02391 family protein [Streptomyces sp. NPDC058220]|uniref:TIGR02391 family protein n=1 Tax=Streptomyces sp. NPDC058220 TaxID=3346387 RepID=UPI0036EFE4BB
MTDNAQLDAGTRELLQAVYALLKQRGDWPTFTAVDLWVDRHLGIEDAQAALLAVPDAYLFRPWQAHGFSSNDPVRLTLRGVTACDGGPEDLHLLERFVAWTVDLEIGDTSPAETPLTASSKAFADYEGLPIDNPDDIDESPATGTSTASAGAAVPASPASSDAGEKAIPAEVEAAQGQVARLRVLVDLLPGFWSSSGWASQNPWLWNLTLDRPRLRPYRHVHGVDGLLEYTEKFERERTATASARMHRLTDAPMPSAPDDVTAGLAEEQTAPVQDHSLDVLLSLLREEIVDSCQAPLRADLYDEAVFAAFRRLEDEIQQRSVNSAIGDTLIKAAFKDKQNPIRISDRDGDMDRMVQLFAGAIGLFKGDRSHKDRPSVPCVSRRECLRILAHASSLLDLLDRDLDRAPAVRGYQYDQGDLTLWVERAGSQVQVWLDETVPLTTRSFQPGTLVVDVSAVSPGEHRVHLVDGTRHGPAHPVWLVRDPRRSTWHRVTEVGVPLYADDLGQQLLDVSGVRVEVLEGGIASERVAATRENYQVGHYVEWRASHSRGPARAAWARDRDGGPLRPLLGSASQLLVGQPSAAVHEERLMRISIEPGVLRLRRDDAVPLRVLGHYTDGTATWTRTLNSPKVESTDEKTAFFKNNVVRAKHPGITTLRCQHDGCYAEALVNVGAHPRWTVTEMLTGLPPVSGIAWTPEGLVVSTRGRHIWRVDTSDGAYRMVTAVPPISAHDQGTDTIAARDDGELAVRLLGERRILVLHHSDDFQSSEIVDPEAEGTPMAFTWHSEALLIAMHDGALHRVDMDGTATELTRVQGTPVALTTGADSIHVLCAPSPGPATGEDYNRLWSVPLADTSATTDLLHDHKLAGINGITLTGSSILLSDFNGGRLFSLRNNRIREVAAGLTNPGQLATTATGETYVADFGAGAIHRLLP